ncbi:penicillin-binding transpeptidase domain-containing protein [Geothrix sp. PMB-07]|uniref:penicillin-binding transpeptidase domain-containing protein n=1 Tax=Geothrix sp. PMB-07 TaxID=3068640 RepID=UPI0027427772|nr:penicillin-binding transpeptidase domain-containing protein [Geothrix sp. PMB-07]WLT30199.1 penicillin-binding transpeptidase domain-containing protein [Geothrix sp. PMB-07]
MSLRFATESHASRRLLGRQDPQDLLPRRMPWIMGGMALWALLILLRLIWLQGVEHKRYQAKADQQHTTIVPVPPIRGELRDRRGEPLAISIKVESLFVDPRVFYPDFKAGKGEERHWGNPDRKAASEMATKLAPILEQTKAQVLEKLLRKKTFVYLERHLPPVKVAAIRALDLDGIEFQPESQRFYPRGSLAAQILGFTNIDGIGQLGIEQTYDKQLSGVKGELIAPRDAHGKLLILQENYSQIPVNGASLQLSLDASIQHIVENALEEGVRVSRPATAYAVVVDPQTGEILAIAGTPTFDPNHILPKKFRNRGESELSAAERDELRRELERQKAARKVHPIEDVYEPGSTMKIFTAAIALEERKVHLGEGIDCMGGRWQYSTKAPPITDTHHHGVLSFEEVLWQSSNVGAAKMGIRLDPAVHYSYLRKFGFGDATGLNFPGESAGRMIAPDRWSVPTQYTFSYGYGLNTTPLQILMAGCALANGGKLMQPILVQRIYNDKGLLLKEFKPTVRGQVLSEETANLMKEALKGVLTRGTGKRAQLDNGVVAFGKTGTSRKLIDGKYDPRRHFASFMGFFPADKPQYGVMVMLDDPAGDTTGGDVAAPLFKRIGDNILRFRETSPDPDREADLKLSLRDWPVSETDEATVHVERGRVPDLKGLSLKAAIHRVVLVGGTPRIEAAPGSTATRVLSQSPDPGAPLEPGTVVKIKAGNP